MNTFFARLGFLSLFIISIVGFSSCETEEVANATITVLQEHTATQGPTLQYLPVAGAEVRIYGPTGSEHIEAQYVTNAAGQVNYSYDLKAMLMVDVTHEGVTYTRTGLDMEPGESTNLQIIIPE